MSTVVGIVSKGSVIIGADSRATSQEGGIRPMIVEKIFRNGPYLIGYVGSVRGGQILRPEYFKPPKTISYMADDIYAQCEAKGCLGLSEDNNNTQVHLCNFIIGYKKKLYEILTDFQLNEIAEYTAIGSGSDYAFGSLCTTNKFQLNDEERMNIALSSASEFDSATAPPFDIQTL